MSDRGSAPPLPTGATIGILGGGQLGRMLAMAARRLGYGVSIFEPEAGCPAAAVADRHVCADFADMAALRHFAGLCDVVTYEFENVPVESARELERLAPVRPGSLALEKCQDRLVEKDFLRSLGIDTAPYAALSGSGDLEAALARFGGRGIVKTRRMGYDGKGQVRIDGPGDVEAAAGLADRQACILEGLVAFDCEISVIAARDLRGAAGSFDPPRNRHGGGILRQSTVPSGLDGKIEQEASAISGTILAALDYVGVMGVEFFVLGDRLLVNEMAPRVHNSGHWTEAACVISQFEQHVRAVTGLPLGSFERHSDCVLDNLIGDDVGRVPELLARGEALVHLYGKAETRPGRKMGHVTRLMGSVSR